MIEGRRRWILAGIAVLASLAILVAIRWITFDDDDVPDDPNAPVWAWSGVLRDREPLSELEDGTPCLVVAFPRRGGDTAMAGIKCGALAFQQIPCVCDLEDADGASGAVPRMTCACEGIFRCDTRAGRCDLDASRLGFALHVAVGPQPTRMTREAVAGKRGLGAR